MIRAPRSSRRRSAATVAASASAPDVDGSASMSVLAIGRRSGSRATIAWSGHRGAARPSPPQRLISVFVPTVVESRTTSTRRSSCERSTPSCEAASSRHRRMPSVRSCGVVSTLHRIDLARAADEAVGERSAGVEVDRVSRSRHRLRGSRRSAVSARLSAKRRGMPFPKADGRRPPRSSAELAALGVRDRVVDAFDHEPFPLAASLGGNPQRGIGFEIGGIDREVEHGRYG